MSFKSGFITIIGRPNSGKSTLLNAILGEKISIVSEKAQTTRNTVRGVKNLKDCQIIFIDTPGIHKGGGLLNKFMQKEVAASIRDVDCVLYMAEADKPLAADSGHIRGLLTGLSSPVVLAINKVDKVNKLTLLPLIKGYSELYPFKEIVPICALTGDGVGELVGVLAGLLPEGPKYFPDDTITDAPERLIAAEMIREKVFQMTRDEVPYSTAVVVESFKENKKLVSISASIVVERDSQKGIIIGKGGGMLKNIGMAARLDIERLLGVKVFLELFVRVDKDWTKSPGALKEFGY